MEEIKTGRYRHFKGNEYRVLYIAKHSETLEWCIRRCTANMESGYARRACGMSLSSAMARHIVDLLI